VDSLCGRDSVEVVGNQPLKELPRISTAYGKNASVFEKNGGGVTHENFHGWNKRASIS
jgi:hypothetical protein